MKQFYNSLLLLQGENDDSVAEAPSAYGGFYLFHFARLPFFYFSFFYMQE